MPERGKSDAAHAIAIPGRLHEELSPIRLREAKTAVIRLTVFATRAVSHQPEALGEKHSLKAGLQRQITDQRRPVPQNRTQFAECTEMPHPGGGGRKAQRDGGFGVAELLEVPHQNDVAVILVELLDRREEPGFQLPADVRGGRSQLLIGELADEIE
jgi:hypothetical protein